MDHEAVAAEAEALGRPDVTTIAIALIAALLGVVPQASGQSKVPSDLALFLETDCPADTVDTELGTFTRRVWDRGVTTVRVAFDAEQRAALWPLVEAARVFEYPAEFAPGFEGGFSVPFPHHTVRVRASGRRHTIHWGAVAVPNAEAKRLAHWSRAVHDCHGSTI